jgi:pilus assembly protein CpaE
LMVDPSEVAFVQQALFAGARSFILKPFTETQLTVSLHQALAAILQQRQTMSAAATGTVKRSKTAQILAVFSPKGGLGRTSLATNLAVALRQETRKHVTLVDGDLQFGDLDIAVNAIAHTSLADLLGYINELDPALIESAMVSHPTGIRLLLAPAYFDPALEISEGRLTHIVKTLAAAQDGYVVIDTPAGLGEVTLSLLDIAHRVLLVTKPTLASLRATKRFVELAARLDYPPDKVMLVLNNYRKDADLAVEEIERHLNCPVVGIVPSDPHAMSLSLNQGQPILCRDKNHAISKAVAKLARQLTGEAVGDATPASATQASAAQASEASPAS